MYFTFGSRTCCVWICSNKTVYICTGSSFYAYHVNKICLGLSNCQGEIKSVTISETQQKNRKP